MSEQEMLQEIERLRRELAKVREDRNHLHKALCQMLPFEEIQWTAEEMREMLEKNVTILDLLEDAEDSFDGGVPHSSTVPMNQNDLRLNS